MKDEFEAQTEELLEDQSGDFQDNDEGLSLDDLLNEAEQEATQEAEPSKEESAANRERAERLAVRFNGGLWWGLSKAYPAAKIENKVIDAGKDALIPLAEKYSDSMPSWVDDFMEKPEIKAGLYVGSAIMAARASHFEELAKQQAEAEKEAQGGESGN